MPPLTVCELDDVDIPKPGGKILCVGLICVDILSYTQGYPEEDSDTRCVDQTWTTGGNATNNVIVLKQLKNDCDLFGTLGDDHASRFAVDYLHSLKIDVGMCPVRQNQNITVSCCNINLQNGSRTIIHAPRNLKEYTFDEFRKIFPTAADLLSYSLIHFEGRNAVELRKILDYLTALRASDSCLAHLKISIEIEKTFDGIEVLIPGADIVFLSKKFAQRMGYADSKAAVQGIAAKFTPSATVICGWGESGASAYNVNSGVLSAPACVPDKVVDTLGAGDTFIAGVLHCLNADMGLQESLDFGCVLSGKKCGIRGLIFSS